MYIEVSVVSCKSLLGVSFDMSKERPLWTDIDLFLPVGRRQRPFPYTLQNTATHCNTLQHTATHRNTLQHTATHCNTLQHTATHCNTLQHTATHCNTLQHTATHCYTLQHTATHCNTLQHTATYCNTLQHTATHCNTLQHTATHCNTLHHWYGRDTAPSPKSRYPLSYVSLSFYPYVLTWLNTASNPCVWVMPHSQIYIYMSHVSHTYISHACVTWLTTWAIFVFGIPHCKTLQHTATHCSTLQHTATHRKILQYTATHCNTLQHRWRRGRWRSERHS